MELTTLLRAVRADLFRGVLSVARTALPPVLRRGRECYFLVSGGCGSWDSRGADPLSERRVTSSNRWPA